MKVKTEGVTMDKIATVREDGSEEPRDRAADAVIATKESATLKTANK